MDPARPRPSCPTTAASDAVKHLAESSPPAPAPHSPEHGSPSADDDHRHYQPFPHYPNRPLQLLRPSTPPSSPKPRSTPSPLRRPRPSSAQPSPSAPVTPLLPPHAAPPFPPHSPHPSPSAASPPPPPHRPPSPPVPAFSVHHIQHRIRAISRDPTLSDAEKNRQRQAILSQPFQQRRKREAAAFYDRMHRTRHVRTYSNVPHPETGDNMPGCEHYPRYCKLKAECCGLWVVCRLCHDHPSMDHSMTRFCTKEIMCMLCFTVQPVSARCVNAACAVEFARYFCPICKFYDNTPGKDIYHCHKCKICRVGKGIGHDNFHCDRCDACVSREYSKDHRCLKKSLDANCPICGLYLYTSTKPVIFMRCGHTMHSHCFDTYTAEHYVCPLCHKALTNMQSYYAQIDEAVKREVMPPEHRNKVSEVLCHDCGERSETPFHFLYLKCQTPDCGSYNTRLLRTYEKGSAAAAPIASGPEAQEEVFGGDNGADNGEA